jgi:RHS repeat-associated protein
MAGNVRTEFVGSLYEKTGSLTTKYVFLGGTRVASLTNGKTMYYHNDHLGGTNVMTDSIGVRKELIEYDPYGEYSRHDKWGTDDELARFYFTGKRKDDESGLIYFGARYYDPKLGRFITADTIVQNPFDPQTLNRYSYTSNNPINRIDLDGHRWSWRRFFGAVVGAALAVVTAGIAAPIIAGAFTGLSVATVGAISGAIGGAIGGAASAGIGGGSIWQGALLGGALGGLGGWAYAGGHTGVLAGMFAGGVGLAAATDSWDSFAGGLVGSIAGIGINSAFSKANSSSSRVDKLADQLANDGNLAGDNIGANFAKAILELNQESNILAKIAMIDRVTAVVDKGVWWSTFGKSFVDGVANSTYIDGGATFAAPGTLKPAFKIGFRISSKGLDGYYGFGLGSGTGASLTVNTSMGASNSIYAGITVKGGTGIYGYSLTGSEGFSGAGASGGVGWGIGRGVNVGATHRKHLWP